MGGTVEQVTINSPADARDSLELESKQQDSIAELEAKEKPEWLLPKYKSIEDQAKAYAELEKHLASKGKANGEARATTEPEGSATSQASDGVQQDVEQPTFTAVAGVDLSSFMDKWQNQGKLDDGDYQQLEKLGFPKAVVEIYERGARGGVDPAVAQQLANNDIASIKAIAGGDQGYNQLIQWATSTLSKDEIEAFNNAVEQGKQSATLAVRGLHSLYQNATGREGKLIHGGAATEQAADLYASTHEMMADMKDKRYGKDPAFTKMVENKVKRSNVTKATSINKTVRSKQ